ncbi:MAG: urea ABC transporter ATP-binding subunit UrtE [SAR324 cluster bacterium]|nr:urea ABC transporter ATP-binding subunit UrtE [SAR324 cluster bacterium]
MLSIQGLNQYYGESHTLWDVDLTIKSGTCLCLMGRNGVGKTTLLKAIMGLLQIKNGSIKLDEQELQDSSSDVRVKAGIGYVPQGREIFPFLTVEENLKVGLSARRDKVRTVPEKIYDLFPVLKDMANRRGGDLSGGQQQQLAIGRALATNPDLLILDEPTEGIQPNIVHDIGDIIIKLNQEEKLTVLLVEQKLPFARRVAKEFCIMEKGRIVAGDSIDALDDKLIQKHLAV